jgi:hypothetical protein
MVELMNADSAGAYARSKMMKATSVAVYNLDQSKGGHR